MRKTAILCLVSGVLGALAALVLYDPPPMPEPTSEAQELAAPDGRTPLPDVAAPSPPAPAATAPPTRPAAAAPAAAPSSAAPYPAGMPTAAPYTADGMTPEERINVAVYEAANRSVVNINTKSVQTDMFFMREIISPGEGSGVVIDRRGHVLTNFHVVDGAREVMVTLFNTETYKASLIGVDPDTDTAVLKIDAPSESLHPVRFGSSSDLKVGQRVYAIGNPFGLERTMTTGIISSLNREIPSRRNYRSMKAIIQIDAAINPGNSGGPLLDSRARMIGMNTAIASKTGESAGVGFAIPINTIARVAPQLIAEGRVTRADAGIAQVYPTEAGLLIARLVPGGAAEKAGLKGPKIVRQRRREGPFVYESTRIDRTAADLIVAVGGQPVRTPEEFLSAIGAHQPGEEVTLRVVREGRELDVPVRLEADQ